MKTSYFTKYFIECKGIGGVSIARSSPKWYTGLCYIELAPPWKLIRYYKNSSNSQFIKEQQYTVQYNELVLNKLDPHKVYKELIYLTEPNEPILLCWEKEGEFCHRHLVTDWLMRNIPNLKITEK